MHPFVAWSPDLTLLGNQCFLKSRLNLMDTWNPWVINPNFQGSYSALAVFCVCWKVTRTQQFGIPIVCFPKRSQEKLLGFHDPVPRSLAVLVFACLLICLFACLLVCLFACLLISLFACFLVALFPCLLVCLFACLLKSRLHLAAPLINSRTGLEILK